MKALRPLTVCLLAAFAAAQDPLAVPLADRVPGVADLSTWMQRTEHRGGAVDKSRRGVFPIGNGRVFGYFGMHERAATVAALSGPTYQTDAAWAPQGHFGEQTFALRTAGGELALPRQIVARVRGAGVVVTEDRSDDGVALVTLNFAAANGDRIYRIVEVQNGSKQALQGVELVAMASQAKATGNDELRAAYDSQQRPFRATFRFAADGVAHGDTLVRAFGEVAAGQTVRAEFCVHTFSVADTTVWGGPIPDEAEKQLAQCLAWWRARLQGTATVKSDPPRVADLFEDWKVLLLVQRSAAAGLVAGMVDQRVCRVRDLAGPMLLCLRYNLWDDAKAMLQAVWRATGAGRALPEELPLDAEWPEPAATVKWDEVAVPPGVGCLVILLHEWYWRSTGDFALLRTHLPMLQRCLDAQRFTPEGLQPFTGREDHFVLHRLLGDRLTAGAALVAHDEAAGRQSLSLDGSVLFLMANLAMGEVHAALKPPPAAPDSAIDKVASRIDGEYMQRTIEVALRAERHFWQPADNRFAAALSPLGLSAHPAPIANSNLRLQWLGWTFASTEKNRHNLQGTLHALWRAPDAVRVGMTPGTGFSTGATQPLLLYALADLDDRARDGAFAELLRMAGPAGEWGELHDPDGRPTWSRDPAWPARCSPAVAGLAIDAICFASTGMRAATVPGWDDRRQARFRPRLPPATTAIDFRDIRRDGRHLHLHIDQAMAKLSPIELEQEAEMLKAGMIQAKDKKDPEREHLRLRYRIEMENPPADADHIVCAVNAGRSTLIRYLAQSLPSFGDSIDPPVDQRTAYPMPGEPVEPWRLGAPAPAAQPYDTLLFAARPGAKNRRDLTGTLVIDAGLPLDPERLAALWLQDGKPRCKTIVFEPGVRAGGALTGKEAGFWQQPAVRDALQAFVAAGGRIEE